MPAVLEGTHSEDAILALLVQFDLICLNMVGRKKMEWALTVRLRGNGDIRATGFGNSGISVVHQINRKC